ncbi:hypothetical protein K438DRAFT_1990599 [Mycena galopus ATCC 62051]|nr:hypothetical protein K438DRAFT_1990599 [Mycena galopus ATCC 62051]
MPRAPKSCANPLFYAWVEAFHDEKDYRKRGGPPRATGYENALRSIAACTTKYAHPREMLVLNGVGPTCVERLEEKLEEHCARKGIPMPEFKKKERGGAARWSGEEGCSASPKAKVPAEEDEDSDADFEAPKKRARADDDEEYGDESRTEQKENVQVKRRMAPARASAKRAIVVAPESSDGEY